MPVRLEPGLLAAADAVAGDLVLLVDPSGDVGGALAAAVAALGQLAHPDEPADAWANLAVADRVDGRPALRVDLKDGAAHPGVSAVVIGVLAAALAAHGVDADVLLARPPADVPGKGEGVRPDPGPPPDPAVDEGIGAVRDFPWPAGAFPDVRPGREHQVAVLVPRPRAEVLAELRRSVGQGGTVAAEGTVTAAGPMRGALVLFCRVGVHDHLVGLHEPAPGLTRLWLTTPFRWADVPPEQREGVTWSRPPGA